jgi:hypothetical protein
MCRQVPEAASIPSGNPRKGTEMSSDDVTEPAGDSTLSAVRSLPFDTASAHQARIYDYVLGGCFL